MVKAAEPQKVVAGHSTVLMLKPSVGEMVSTGSPLNLGKAVKTVA